VPAVAEFEATEIALRAVGPGIRSEWSTEIEGIEFWVLMEWAPDLGVVDFWVCSPESRADVLWLADPALAQLLADTAVEWQGSEQMTAPRVEWRPALEFGVDWAPAAEGFKHPSVELVGTDGHVGRQIARQTGRPLVARRAGGPWRVVPG
jgi:hypothetical protein